MTPDVLVWVATPRNGIAYHVIRPDRRYTECGRYVGERSTGPLRGHVLSLAEVVDRFGSAPCRQCTGDLERVAPKVRPSRDAPWV